MHMKQCIAVQAKCPQSGLEVSNPSSPTLAGFHPAELSLSKTLNPFHSQEYCSGADPDLSPPCGGGQVIKEFPVRDQRKWQIIIFRDKNNERENDREREHKTINLHQYSFAELKGAVSSKTF